MTLFSLSQLASWLLLGAGIGWFGGLFGIGGGVIAIPLMVIAFGMDQAMAQGTALVLMVPNLVIGWWRYQQRHAVNWVPAAIIAVSATVTTGLIAAWATRLDASVLGRLFAGFLGLLALYMLWQTRGSKPLPPERPLRRRWVSLLGVAGGSSMGLFGIGGGLLAAPVLSGWLGQRQTVAQSLALALVAPSSAMALFTYAEAQRVDWQLGIPLAVGGMFTVSAGVALAHRLPERTMRIIFALMLLSTALWLGLVRH